MKKLLMASLLALTLSACAGTNFSWDNARQIKAGMTEEEVTAIMGNPYLVRSQGDELIYVWTYATGFGSAKTVSAVFADGKVKEAPKIPVGFK